MGFINKLPHSLVEAFKSTLEEAVSADLLLIVNDLSSPCAAKQRQVVGEVLSSLVAQDMPVIVVYNKSDQLKDALPRYSPIAHTHISLSLRA